MIKQVRPFQILRHKQGFTLSELMIVMAVMGTIAFMAIPRLNIAMLDAQVQEAVPWLTEIAAKNRMYMLENGLYCCGSSTIQEDEIVSDLGVQLADVGDFCFVMICRDASLCETPVSTDFIAPAEADDPTIEFEVWAVLRSSSSGAINAPNATSCTPATGKRDPSGWVRSSTSGDAGREGQVYVLRYAPPPDGRDAVQGAREINYEWLDGFSKSMVLRP